MDEERHSLELQALDCALAVDLVQQAAQRKQRQQEATVAALTTLRDRRGALLPRVQALAEKAVRQYEDLSTQEKQVGSWWAGGQLSLHAHILNLCFSP